MIFAESHLQQKLNGRGNDKSVRPLSSTAPSTGGGIFGAGASLQPSPTVRIVTTTDPDPTFRRVPAGITLREVLETYFPGAAELQPAINQAMEAPTSAEATPVVVSPPNAPNTAPTEQQAIRVPGEIRLFEKIMEQWGLGDAEAARLLGYEEPSTLRSLYSGSTSLRTIDEKDRLRAVLRIAADLHALFRDEGEVKAWLREPKARLGGKSAYDLMTNGSMEYLLYVRQFVEFLSGR